MSDGGRGNYGTMDNRVPDINFAGPGPSSGYFDDRKFSRICDTITSNIFQIGKYGMYLV